MATVKFEKIRERENGILADYIGNMTDDITIILYASCALRMRIKEAEVMTADKLVGTNPPQKIKDAVHGNKSFPDSFEVADLSFEDFGIRIRSED